VPNIPAESSVKICGDAAIIADNEQTITSNKIQIFFISTPLV